MTAPHGCEIVVGVGDCRIADFPSPSLNTYALGSCLAVIVYDWKKRLGGLLHVMLPDSSINPVRAATSPFVYVDTGVPELFREMERRGGIRRRIRCCIAGGANMMADSAQFEIGKRNYLALKKAFRQVGVFIDREDVGGTESRSVRLDLSTGQIDVRKGVARGRILVPAGITFTERSANDAGAVR